MDNFRISTKPIEIAEYKNYKIATFLISVLDEFDGNGRLITKEAGEKYHKSIIGYPIVAKLVTDIFGNPINFAGHDAKQIRNKDGQIEYRFGTMPIGSVLDSYIEEREVDGYDGMKSCIMIKCKLWSDRFPEYFQVLDKLWAEGSVESSWELDVIEKEEIVENSIVKKIIKAFELVGNCILGKGTVPAVSGAGMVEYAELNGEQTDEMALACALSRDSIQCSDKKYEQKEESMEKNNNIPEEATAEEVDNTITPEAEEAEKEAGTEEKETDVETEKSEQEVGETASLTAHDLRQKLQTAYEKEHRYAWIAYWFPEENYVLVEDEDKQSELEYTKATYEIVDDEVTFTNTEKVKLVVSIAKINSEIASKNDTIAELNEKIVDLETQISSLNVYKERCDKEDEEKQIAEMEAKKESLKAYALKSKQITEAELETEEFKKMISELDETGIKAIISDRLVSAIEKSKKVETAEKELHVETPKLSIEDDDVVINYKSIMNNVLK